MITREEERSLERSEVEPLVRKVFFLSDFKVCFFFAVVFFFVVCFPIPVNNYYVKIGNKLRQFLKLTLF